MKGFLVKLDIGKAFKSFKYAFLTAVLDNYGFKKLYQIDDNFNTKSRIFCN